MLRSIGNARIAPRVIGVKATSAAAVATVNIGTGDVYSATSAADGKVALTLKEPFSRTGVMVGSPMSDTVNNAGSFVVPTDPTVSVFTGQTMDGSAAGDDGGFHSLIVGWDSYQTDYLDWGRIGAPFPLKGTWSKPRILRLKITGDATTPTVDIGNPHVRTLTRNGAGDYSVTLKHGFGNDSVVAVAMPIAVAQSGAFIVSATSAAVRVLTTQAGVGADLPFYLIIMGSDNVINGSQHRRVIQTPGRLCRAMALHVSYSAGTPSLTKGTGEVTLTDTGTGQLTLAFARAFAAEPIVIACKDTDGGVTAEAGFSSTGGQLDFWNTAGAAADPADVHILVFGTEDANEFFGA